MTQHIRDLITYAARLRVAARNACMDADLLAALIACRAAENAELAAKQAIREDRALRKREPPR